MSFEPFWGRKSEMLALEEKIQEGPVVVTGLPGVGKSRLVYTYAKEHARRYHVVWTLDASQRMDRQMIDFANKLHGLEHKGREGTFSKKEDAVDYVKSLLRTCTFSWLLMFDGVAHAAAVKDVLPETFGAKDKHVVMTSLSDQGVSGSLRVSALTDGEAHAFLKHYLKNASDKDIGDLARLLDNHPLALLSAATYINATPHMTIPAYIAFFSQNKKAYWASESKVLGDQPQLYTTLKISLDQLKMESGGDYTLLVALCLLDTHKLEGSFIQGLYGHVKGADAGGFSKILDLSLVTKRDKTTYAVHDYVRDVVLATADGETLQKAAEATTSALLALFPDKVEDCVATFEKNPALVGQLKTLMTRMDLLPGDAGFALGVRTFYYTYYFLRDYPYAYALSDQLTRFLATGKVVDPLLVANFHNANAYMTFLRKGMDAALQELLLAKASFEKMPPDLVRRELVMLLGNNLGFKYHWQGNLDAVEKCVREAEALQEGHTDIMGLAIVGCLKALLAQDRGHFEDSLRALNDIIAMTEKDPTENKVAGHYFNSLKACSLLKLAQMKELNGRMDEARALRREALTLSKTAYAHAVQSSGGKDDTDIVARTLLYFSQAQSACGEPKKAEGCARRAIAIFDRELMGAGKNRRQGVAYIALGDALSGQGKHEEASKAYLMAEEIFNKISTHKAFDDMSEVWARLVQNAIVRGDANTARRCLNAHKNTFHGLHPRYIMMAAKVASV
ncbi:MAG: hypothetical protein LCH26_00945 [Proteobacteria bacterium]|nr:hypothetical protein [Pseudomonadota bacterium]